MQTGSCSQEFPTTALKVDGDDGDDEHHQVRQRWDQWTIIGIRWRAGKFLQNLVKLSENW